MRDVKRALDCCFIFIAASVHQRFPQWVKKGSTSVHLRGKVERCLLTEGWDLLMKEIKIDQLLQVLSPLDQCTPPFTSWHSDY